MVAIACELNNQNKHNRYNGLNRTLYVGIGGIGIKAIAATKRYFAEAYGNVPSSVGFLGIDTDAGAYKFEQLGADEIVNIAVRSPKSYYESNQDSFNWLSQKNVRFLVPMACGAGQLRSNGRFAITVNYREVLKGLNRAIDRIVNAPGEEALDSKNAAINVNLVFSLCGGTGSGAFINMAYIVKKYVRNCRVNAFAVMPDVFSGVAPMASGNVGANAYASMLELDYLMSAAGDEEVPYELQMGETTILKEKPFDNVFLVDNKNNNGDKYQSVDQLKDALALTLYTAAGELGDAVGTQLDSSRKTVEGLAVGDKKAWVNGIGLCEIVVDPEKLKSRYALGAASGLIDEILSPIYSSKRADDYARRWSSVDPLDRLSDLMTLPLYCNDVSDGSIYEVVSRWVQEMVPAEESVNERKNAMLTGIKSALDGDLNKVLKSECGVPLALESLSKLLAAIDGSKQGIDNRRRTISDAIQEASKAKDDAIHRMLTKKSLFHRASTFYPEINSAVNDLVSKSADLVRHKAACSFYDEYSLYIQQKIDGLKHIADMLQAAQSDLREQLRQLESSKSDKPYQIDISPIMPIDSFPHYSVSKFVDSLGNGLMSFAGKSCQFLLSTIKDYCYSLEADRRVRIDYALGNIKRLDEEQYDSIIKTALAKSSILLQRYSLGYQPNDEDAQPFNSLFIAAKDRYVESRYLEEPDNLFSGCGDFTYAEIPDDNRIVFLRVAGSFPACQIDGITKLEAEYKESSKIFDPHIDAGLESIMRERDFSLTPRKIVEKPVEKSIEKPVEKIIEKPVVSASVVSESKVDIFISYRRDGGLGIARNIYLALGKAGYENVFFDYNSLHDGDYREKIAKAIKGCKDYILVLSEGAMDRCVNEDDLVRMEMTLAVESGCNIIPVTIDRKPVVFPPELPEKLKVIQGIQFTDIKTDACFDYSIKMVCDRLKTSPKVAR